MNPYETKKMERGVSVDSRTRSVRIAYIVEDGPNSHEILDEVFAEGYSRWGGRRTLIIPLSDNKIEEEYLKFLTWFDPDLVYCFPNLSQKFIDLIDSNAKPIWFLKHPVRREETSNWRPQLPVSFVSSLSMLPFCARRRNFDFDDKQRFLVDCLLSWKDDRFLGDNFGIWHRSFGDFPEKNKLVMPLTLGKEDDPHIKYDKKLITNEVDFLNHLAKFRNTLSLSVFSAIASYVSSVSNNPLQDSLNLVIGDEFLDRLIFWNSRLLLPEWRDEYLPAIRVSEDKFEDGEFIRSFCKFLNNWNHMAPDHLRGLSCVTIRSSSISKENLNTFKDKLIMGGIYKHGGIYVEELKPYFPKDKDYKMREFSFKNFPDSFRILENPSRIKPKEPLHYSFISQESRRYKVGYWINDLKIERHNNLSRFINIFDWWRLPRRYELVPLFTGSTQGKVSSEGYLSIIPKISDRFSTSPISDELFIDLKFPEDYVVFNALICSQRYYESEDLRIEEKSVPPFEYFRYSRPGKIFNGIVEMFGGLDGAFQFLSNSYWVNIFNSLGVSKRGNEDVVQRLKTVLKRKFNVSQEDEELRIGREEDWDTMADVLITSSKSVRLPKEYISYSKLIESGSCYIEGESEEDIEEKIEMSLKRLIEIGVFSQGKQWSCKKCSHKNWTSIDCFAPFQPCEICGEAHQAPVKIEWDFYLNEFFSESLREHGIHPVIWVLGMLHEKARESFFYISSIELFKKYPIDNSSRLFGEIDFACILEGEFLIGEAKTSVGYFTEKVISNLIEQANLIKPDVVVLACFENNKKVLEEKSRTIYEACKFNIKRVEVLVPSDVGFVEKTHYLPH